MNARIQALLCLNLSSLLPHSKHYSCLSTKHQNMTEYNTLNDAWNGQIRVITIPNHCDICFEPFLPNHQPVSSFGHQSCTYVFGDSCLRAW